MGFLLHASAAFRVLLGKPLQCHRELWRILSGFTNCFPIVKPSMPSQYPDEPWYVIGHSMGAAMATLCALDLRFRLAPTADVRVYTFGSPRVGNAVFATFFGSVIQVRQQQTDFQKF